MEERPITQFPTPTGRDSDNGCEGNILFSLIWSSFMVRATQTTAAIRRPTCPAIGPTKLTTATATTPAVSRLNWGNGNRIGALAAALRGSRVLAKTNSTMNGTLNQNAPRQKPSLAKKPPTAGLSSEATP